MAPLDSVKGFAVTFRHLFRKPVTQQYPEYKRSVYPRFRGRHRLHRHENGLEKCIGWSLFAARASRARHGLPGHENALEKCTACSLCAPACPADCIRVVAAENQPDQRVSPGE